jgi:hypothetical protein
MCQATGEYVCLNVVSMLIPKIPLSLFNDIPFSEFDHLLSHGLIVSNNTSSTHTKKKGETSSLKRKRKESEKKKKKKKKE